MSRMATKEYIGAKRRAYALADRAKRMRILDEVCETTGYERKYANRLLTGSRKFRERKGRGKTYGTDVAETLKKVWLEAGCPCLPYFKAAVEDWVEEYATQVAHIKPEIREKLLAMSDRTMSRMLSGEVRFDCPSLHDELVKLCDDWSDFRNFFCSCKMLVTKEKRPDGKGYRCKYDNPKTPYQRVLDEHVLTPEQESALKSYRARLSGMELYRKVRKRLRKIRRIQEAYNKAKHAGEDLSSFAAHPALALRATPSGTVGLHREGRDNTTTNQRKTIAEERKLSVQYLANQKPPDYLQSVFSI